MAGTQTRIVPTPSTVPPTASGLVGSVQAVSPAGAGSLTAFAAGTTLPGTSNLNFTADRTVANLAVTAGPSMAVHYNGTAASRVVVDLFGYFR